MRLQVIVHRHGIPPVQLLWTTGTRPPFISADSSITISQFLEQLNEVIPLESEDWGLEDYAVEVRGFECLHFSVVGQVLREDDEVCIRPLLTNDLRMRRISGRHQISADGKHLIDGVAFGRPLLRRPNRPPVRIPPRKRRCIMYDAGDEVESEEEVSGGQVVIRAGFNEGDEAGAGEGSEDEEEHVPNEDGEEEDLSAELKALQQEAQPDSNGENSISDRIRPRRSRQSPKGLGLLQLRDEDGRPFDGQYRNPLLDKYGGDEYQITENRSKRRKLDPAKVSPKTFRGRSRRLQDAHESHQQNSRRDSTGSAKSVHFEDSESATPATIRDVDHSEEEDDIFQPDDVNESDKENAEPLSDQTDSDKTSSEGSGSSSLTSSERAGSDATSSSGSSPSESSPGSGSSSDSDTEPNELPAKAPRQASEDSETSSSGLSSSSSSSSSDTEMENRRKRRIKPVETSLPKGLPKNVVPGTGTRRTQTRNRRRQAKGKLTHLCKLGVLPAKSTIADLRDFEKDLSNQREALLSMVHSEGMDLISSADPKPQEPQSIEDEEQDHIPEVTDRRPGKVESETLQIQSGENNHRTKPTATAVEVKSSKEDVSPEIATPQFPVSVSPSTVSQANGSAAQNRRSKLDVSGAKRMLFSSLGVKTPKNKEDENSTREKLMKDVRPLPEPQANIQTDSPLDLAAIAADDSWKKKIDLRAVECCHGGIRLSTPPFPFVQRWDPQQRGEFRYGNSRKRRGKKRKRNNDNYYDDSTYQDPHSQIAHHDDEENFPTQSLLSDVQGPVDIEEAPIVPEESLQDAVNQQISRETDDILVADHASIHSISEDLPRLPQDLTTCPELTREAAVKGNVIAFKQLEMSAETNWQPQISNYCTAIVNDMTEKGSLLLIPAKRNRFSKQVEYDHRTGERLYEKFEMPGFNDNENDDDDELEILFDELINPILVRAMVKSTDQIDDEQEEIQRSNNSQASEMSPPSVANGDHGIENPAMSPDNVIRPIGTTVAFEPSKEDREEISELMRDAGWRSSVQAGVDDSLRNPGFSSHGIQEDNRKTTTLIDAPSPTFNGFGSSPVVDVRSSPPIVEKSTSKRHISSDTEIADSLPRGVQEVHDTTSEASDHSVPVAYPRLPQVENDSELLHEEAQQRSDPLIDSQVLSQAMVANPLYSEGESLSKHMTSFDGGDSEDEFPEPFSQAWNDRLSQDTENRRQTSQENVISPPFVKRSRLSIKAESLLRESDQSWRPDNGTSDIGDEDDDDGASTPRPSQQQMSSQILDLTMSSSPAASQSSPVNGNIEDSLKLPRDPGWIKKTRASREPSGSVKAK